MRLAGWNRAGLVAALSVGTFAGAWGFALLDLRWATPTADVSLRLGSAGEPLRDGAASFDEVAAGALATWNSWISAFQFVPVGAETRPGADNDLVNSVWFDSDVFGKSFDGAIAVATTRRLAGIRTEGDVIFNDELIWDSYRGPLVQTPGGETIFDLRRVALHEFGHVLGLNHPDQIGQEVAAIMNSRISDVGELTADDVRGAQSLYGVGMALPDEPSAPPRPGEQVQVDRPRQRTSVTRQTKVLMRGRADLSRVKTVLLRNKRASGRQFPAKGVLRWARRMPLALGSNRIEVFVELQNGGRFRFRSYVVRRIPR